MKNLKPPKIDYMDYAPPGDFVWHPNKKIHLISWLRELVAAYYFHSSQGIAGRRASVLIVLLLLQSMHVAFFDIDANLLSAIFTRLPPFLIFFLPHSVT
jgi:hypothetical protein